MIIRETQNVLHRYRTYAYHHVLIACDSTQTADYLSSSSDVTDFQHQRTPNGFEKYTVRTTKVGNGKYVVLIDGTTDASIYIQDLTLKNVVISNENHDDGRTTIQAGKLSAEMTVVEINGALFFNLLVDSCQALEVHPFSVFFFIKTIFIGYLYDGTVESITNISPFTCSLLDSTADFSSAGAVYKLSFAGRENGVADTPIISGTMGSIYVGEELADKSKNGIPLFQVLKAIESRANQVQQEVSDKRRESLQSDRKEEYDNTYAPVKFYISAHEDYQNPDYYVESKDERIENGSNSFYLESPKEATVGLLIEAALSQCRKILEEQIDNAATQYRPVINRTVKTTPGLRGGMVVEYFIDKKVKPKAIENDEGKYNLPGIGDADILSLNYVFTGKNIDILDFSMSMQFGTAFIVNLPTMSSIGPVSGMSDKVVNVIPSNGAVTKPASTDKRSPIPHNTGGVHSTNPLIRNTRDPLLASKFYAALSQHAQFESLSVQIKIAGNPRFMGMSYTDRSVGPYEYARINIMMPDPQQKDEHAPIPFWFNGVYRVLDYMTKFENGLFTQELTLSMVPYDTPLVPEMAPGTPPPYRPTPVDSKTLDTDINDGTNLQGPFLPPIADTNTWNTSTTANGDARSMEHILNRIK